MAQNKRSKTECARDRLVIAERYIKGETQGSIADSMGLSQQQICYDLDVIRRAWTKEAILDIDKAKARELAKISRLENTYWAAWERSCQPRERTQTRTVKADSSLTEAGITKEARDGNPAFLAGIMTCIDRRCKILGLDAPIRFDLAEEARKVAKEFGLPDSETAALVAEAEAIATGRAR